MYIYVYICMCLLHEMYRAFVGLCVFLIPQTSLTPPPPPLMKTL